MSNKNFYSKTFVRDLMIIDAIVHSDFENPKTGKQILDEAETRLKRIFPNSPFDKTDAKKSVTATISRHVSDMNQSGLFRIETHRDNRLGYFNACHLFTAAEATLLASAIYRTRSLSDDETQKIFDKIKSATTLEGQAIIYGFERQIKKFDAPRRKNPYKIFSVIKNICRAIIDGKKISFNLRPHNVTKNISQKVTACPQFIVWDSNEVFLTATVDDATKNFKVALMSAVKILDEEFRATKNFSLDKHLSENIFMSDAVDDKIELKISFPESFVDTVTAQFGCGRILSLAPNGKFFDGERAFRATIFATENNGLYRWLRANCDKIRIIAPANVIIKLKEQLALALTTL